MTDEAKTKKDAVLRGSCTCGGIQFEIRGPFVGINQCHCDKCRKETGAGSSTFIPATLISLDGSLAQISSVRTIAARFADRSLRTTIRNVLFTIFRQVYLMTIAGLTSPGTFSWEIRQDGMSLEMMLPSTTSTVHR